MRLPRTANAKVGLLALFAWLISAATAWRESAPQLRATLPGVGKPALVAFSPDSKVLVTRTLSGKDSARSQSWWPFCYFNYKGGALRFWDVTTGRERGELAEEFGKPLTLAFSPDGRFVAFRDAETDSLLLVDWATRRRQVVHRFDGYPFWSECCFSPDSAFLAFTLRKADTHCVRLWDIGSGRERATLDEAGVFMAFSPDSRLIATGRAPWTDKQPPPDELEVEEIDVWDALTGKLRATVRSDRGAVTSLFFSPDGNWLVADGHGLSGIVGLDDFVKIWDVTTGGEYATLDCAWGAAFVRDRRTLAASCAPSRTGTCVTLWDVPSKELISSLNGYQQNVSCRFRLSSSPDGRLLAVPSFSSPSPSKLSEWYARLFRVPIGSQCTMKLLDTTNGDTLGTFDGCRDGLFSPDGKVLATECDNGTIKLWRLPPRTSFACRMLHSLLAPSLVIAAWWLCHAYNAYRRSVRTRTP